MNNSNIKFVFFGNSRVSHYVLEELEKAGFSPIFSVTSAKDPLPELDYLRALEADVFVVAAFGKILPQDLLDIPKHGSLNVHPSVLPELRGPAPIQGSILGLGGQSGRDPIVGVTIIKMDEKMDHGPILAQEKVPLSPWPDHYAVVEEKLARRGGEILAELLPKWIRGEVAEKIQDHDQATFIKMIKKEDGQIDFNDPAETNYRKVLAYSTWPQAYFFFTTKNGKELRIVVKDAEIQDGKFVPTRVIPEGKREMVWQDFLRGNS